MRDASFPFPAEDFDGLLQQVLNNLYPMDDLLRHRVFLERGYRICCWHVRNTDQDPWELFSMSFLKALASKDKLRPDNTPDGEAFFSWFFQISLNMQRDLWRKNSRELNRLSPISPTDGETEEESSGTELPDLSIDLDGERLLEEFLEFTKTLPDKYRRAVMLRLENYPDKGYPYEEIAEKLKSEGIKCTHVTIRSWVRASVRAFFNGSKVSSRKKAVSV